MHRSHTVLHVMRRTRARVRLGPAQDIVFYFFFVFLMADAVLLTIILNVRLRDEYKLFVSDLNVQEHHLCYVLVFCLLFKKPSSTTGPFFL